MCFWHATGGLGMGPAAAAHGRPGGGKKKKPDRALLTDTKTNLGPRHPARPEANPSELPQEFPPDRILREQNCCSGPVVPGKTLPWFPLGRIRFSLKPRRSSANRAGRGPYPGARIFPGRNFNRRPRGGLAWQLF